MVEPRDKARDRAIRLFYEVSNGLTVGSSLKSASWRVCIQLDERTTTVCDVDVGFRSHVPADLRTS